MKRTVLVLMLIAGWMPATAESPADLLGLWRVTEIRDLTTGETEPGKREYHMYTQSHEMIVLAGEGRTKLKKSLSDMTADEVMSQQPIGAGFYQYRVEGSELVRTAVLTLSAFYEGRTVRTAFEIDGEELTIRDRHAADGHLREWRMERIE